MFPFIIGATPSFAFYHTISFSVSLLSSVTQNASLTYDMHSSQNQLVDVTQEDNCYFRAIIYNIYLKKILVIVICVKF